MIIHQKDCERVPPTPLHTRTFNPLLKLYAPKITGVSIGCGRGKARCRGRVGGVGGGIGRVGGMCADKFRSGCVFRRVQLEF